MAKCKVCGAPHRSCGPRTTVIPVDERITREERGDMSLKRYTIKTGRRGEHTTTVKLTEAEAKRIGATPVGETTTKAAKAPANKSRTPANKQAKPKAAPKTEAAKAPATAPAPAAVEDASDPDASE